MNKKGKTNGIVWVLVILGAYLLFTSGALDGIIPSNNVEELNDRAPSDRQTTINIHLEDALAATATTADGTFYFFNGDGSFYKTVTTASGIKSTNVEFGKTYTYVVYDDGDTGSDYYPAEGTFIADLSVKPLNEALNKEGNMKIEDVYGRDLDDNMTRPGAGSTVNFVIVWTSNMSNAGTLNPTIIVDVNGTTVDSASLTGYTELPCPSRLTTDADRKKICFRKMGLVTSSDGEQTVPISLLMDASSQTVAADEVGISMCDESMIRAPNYLTVGQSAFTVAAEDTDNSNVGLPLDAPSDYFSFQS